MAELEQKTILTRIINKNASLAEWMSSTLPLKKGEIALAYVETKQEKADANGNITVQFVPTYLMKVGDGTHTFKDLKWLAAPASDVYDWAKKAQLDEDDLPTDVKETLADVANKLDAQTFTEFVSSNGDFGKLKKTVDAFFANDANIEGVVDTLKEIQAYLDTDEDASSLIQQVAAVHSWFEANKIGDATDGITAAKISSWSGAAEKAHEHDNEAILKTITKSTHVHEHSNLAELENIAVGDVDKWNSIEDNVATTYVKHSATDVEYILDCGNHLARTTST